MILTKKEVEDYKKLYKKNLVKYQDDKRLAHYHSWNTFRKQLDSIRPIGWWTLETRNDILKKLYEIEESIESK